MRKPLGDFAHECEQGVHEEVEKEEWVGKMLELLLGLTLACFALVGGLIIWYLRKIAQEAWRLGFLIWDIARNQGWIEVKEE